MPEPTTAPVTGTEIKATPPDQVAPPKPVKAPPSDVSKSFFEEMDELAKDKPKPAPKKEGKEAPPSQRPAASADKTATDTSKADSTASTAGEDSTKTTDQAVSDKPPVKAAELRTAYENLKKEHAALKAEREKEKTAKPAEDPQVKVLLERVDAEKKRADELEEKLRFANYQESKEYKEKYHQPFIDAYTAGRNAAAELTVTDGEGNERPGTPADFDAIMRAPSRKDAAKLAAQMFGDQAASVLYHRERVQEVSASAEKAVEEFRKTAEERSKKDVEQSARQKADMAKAAEENQKLFFSQTKAHQEANPDIFKPEESDTEANALLKRETALVDLGMNLLSPERIEELSEAVKAKLVNGQLPPQERVRLHAAIHTRAIAYPILKRLNKTLTAKVAELEKALEEYKKSEPGPDGGHHEAEKRPMTFDEEMDAIANRR